MKVCAGSRRLYYDWYSLVSHYRLVVTGECSVLEIGASARERTLELAQYCRDLLGIELLPERTPDNLENVRYVTGDWADLETLVEPASIDVVVCSHVIEHIVDDLAAVDALYEVLKPGGVALLNTPNRRRLTRAFIELFTGERRFPYWEHQREYTEKDLLELLSFSRFDRFAVLPVVFGVHGGPIFLYRERVPRRFREYANFLEIHLVKTGSGSHARADLLGPWSG